MKECLLCKKDMKKSKDTFGNGCIKNIYTFLDLEMPRQLKVREKALHKSIMKINSISSLSEEKRILLTDRYLTLEYLNRNPYGDLEDLKSKISYDIKNIDNYNSINKPKSSKLISLKQAYDLYKKVIKFDEGIKKLSKGSIKNSDSIKATIIGLSFIFNLTRYKSQYEKSTFKAMQFVFWQTIIELGGKYAGFPISAYFLQNSLEKKPEDLILTEGSIVDEIKNDNNFKDNIENIIKKYGKNKNEFTFESDKDSNFPMNFNDGDLYFAIHLAKLYIRGKKNKNKWFLNVKLEDKYDYSKIKLPHQYYNDASSVPKSMLSSSLYNFAVLSNKYGVMSTYNIIIKFELEIIEVN